MTGLAEYNFKLHQLYPGPGGHHLNTCANPDCHNFGVAPEAKAERRSRYQTARSDLTKEQLRTIAEHGPGAYKLAGADKSHRRVSQAFHHANAPYQWHDQRTVRCKAMLSNGTICNSGFSILSGDHLNEEIERLRNHNGVLDGPACGACGMRFLAKPDEFSLNGAHQRTKDRNGKPLKNTGAPKAVRVLHKPCKGLPGARISISVPHARQKVSKDNLRILNAVLNSAGIMDAKRMLGAENAGKKMGISRIYDRVSWLEQVFLAYEREMLRRWRARLEDEGQEIEHRLCHDDLVLTVNWETATDRRNTQLNCSVTADARSGFVYRMDVDFDPRIRPIEMFKQCYLDEDENPKNLWREYPDASIGTAPLFSWQRPTGRLHEPQFFAACINELEAFRATARRRLPRKTKGEKAAWDALSQRIDDAVALVREIAQDWFDFPTDVERSRGSFRGMTTRDIYTKAAHFALLKEMLPRGPIVLTTEQEATLPAILPHIFHDEIKANRFTWLAMTFNKKATKPEKLGKVKKYRRARRAFHEAGLYDGKFDLGMSAETITQAFIAENLEGATRGREKKSPFPISNYRNSIFPVLWVKAPSQASGEIDKIVGFPLVNPWLRHRLKKIPFDADISLFDEEAREEIAEHIYKATLQGASTFMNSLRERISMADRAESGGARMGGSFIQGAIFNPKVLISLLNIYRVHYNFFEPRPYASPYNDEESFSQPKMTARPLKFPWTGENVGTPYQPRRRPAKKTPAMRLGLEAFVRCKNGATEVPNLYRVLYRPWLYANTKAGAKLDRSWQGTGRR